MEFKSIFPINRTFIYQKMGPGYASGGGVLNNNQLNYYRPNTGLNKPDSTYVSVFTFSNAVSEINNNRPFVSIRDEHSGMNTPECVADT